jgi:hypothetical protein
MVGGSSAPSVEDRLAAGGSTSAASTVATAEDTTVTASRPAVTTDSSRRAPSGDRCGPRAAHAVHPTAKQQERGDALAHHQVEPHLPKMRPRQALSTSAATTACR